MTDDRLRGDGKYITEDNFGTVVVNYATQIVVDMDEDDRLTFLIELVAANLNDTETRTSLEARIIDSHGEDYLKSVAVD